MTELSFLIDLLLNGRLQKSVQEKVKQRIAEVEQTISLPALTAQQRRVQASLEPPTDHIARTVEAAKAMADRQAAISAAVSQKPIEVSTGNGTKGPRKF